MLTFSQQVAISNPACVKLESDPFPSLPTVALRRLYRELQDSCRGAMDKLTTASMSSIKEGQKVLQQAHAEKGFIHLVGKADRVTSILIPLGLTAVGAVVLTKGLYHMYTGTGKLE